ncbi:MAG TPA: TolC family protein, partial [Candidatus Elarobacter sp.]
MAHLRTLALVMSASISTTLLAPLAAGAQTSPAPQPTPISLPSTAPQPQPTPMAQPSPLAAPSPGAQPTPGAQPSPGGVTPVMTTPLPAATGGTVPTGTTPAAGASGTTPVGTRGGTPQPPPPIPAVLPPVPSVAPGFNAPREPVPNGDLVGVQQQPFVGLALQDAIGMALQRNTDLAIAQSNRRIANYQIIAAQGAYDVRFQLVPSYEHSVQPAVSAFQTGPNGGPITQDTVGAMTGFQGLTQNGGRYSIGLSGSRVQNNSLENSYDPFYQTALALQVTQPLLRGRAIDQNRLQIQLARNNATISNAVALNQASNTVVNVSNAYYDLVAAWRNVAIQEQGLRNAQAQAASNSRLAARGVVAPTDIVEANTQVDVFQDNVFAAIQNVQRLQTQLKQLILANP